MTGPVMRPARKRPEPTSRFHGMRDAVRTWLVALPDKVRVVAARPGQRQVPYPAARSRSKRVVHSHGSRGVLVPYGLPFTARESGARRGARGLPMMTFDATITKCRRTGE